MNEQAESLGLILSKLSVLLIWCTTTEDLHQHKKTPALSEQHTVIHLMSWVTSSVQAIFRLSGWDKDKFRVSAWARFHLFLKIFWHAGALQIHYTKSFFSILADWIHVSRHRLFRYVQCRYTNTTESLNFKTYVKTHIALKKRAQTSQGYCANRIHLSALAIKRG